MQTTTERNMFGSCYTSTCWAMMSNLGTNRQLISYQLTSKSLSLWTWANDNAFFAYSLPLYMLPEMYHLLCLQPISCLSAHFQALKWVKQCYIVFALLCIMQVCWETSRLYGMRNSSKRGNLQALLWACEGYELRATMQSICTVVALKTSSEVEKWQIPDLAERRVPEACH